MKPEAKSTVVTIPGGREIRVAIVSLDGGINFEVDENGQFSTAGRVDATEWPNEHDEQVACVSRRLSVLISETYDAHTIYKVSLALVGLVNRLLR